MKAFALFLFMALALPAVAAAPAWAQEGKPFDWNSIPEEYRTTKEQMEAEAMAVYTSCARNGYQQNFYDCECVAGAILIEREFSGPAVHRNVLVTRVLQSPKHKCANIERIAASTMMNCLRFTSVFMETEPDNYEYCMCMGNTTAKQFETKPIFSPAYIQAVQEWAQGHCMNPANRPAKSTAQADALGVNIPNSQ